MSVASRIGSFVGIFILAVGCSKKSSWDLSEMLQQGKYDAVIETGTERIQKNPEDFGTIILIGDAYYRKALEFNRNAHRSYTPEGAALAKKAIDYYRQAKEIKPSMRVDQKIGIAGALMSPG